MAEMVPTQTKDQRRLLLELGAERLADGLLEFAQRHTDVAEWIERMIASPKENVARYKAKLTALKRRRRFVGWSEAGAYAQELGDLLEDLKAGVGDPQLGAELVGAFFKTDRYIFEQCDDSNGSIGDVFRYDACELFIHYARQCGNHDWLCNLILDLNETDDYGIRDVLIDSASNFLPDASLRQLADQCWSKVEQKVEGYPRSHWMLLVESLARQLKDAPLFEKARCTARPELSVAACQDIAAVYLDAGQAATALSWLERIPVEEAFRADERDQLLIKVHEALGNRDAATDIAWKRFHRYPSEDTLKTLLNMIGEDQRDQVIAGVTQRILTSPTLSYANADFLLKMEKVAEAERYLLDRADQLNGDLYGTLLPLAESMEKAGRFLLASLIYRALLDSILRRAQTKTYPHGIRYLKKLEKLAVEIGDWGDFPSHGDYFRRVRLAHGKKSSFWSRYTV